MIDKLSEIRAWVKQNKPLIHCITNHISATDCANAVLALGARPIMAEHPAEVLEITARANALAVNLGCINDMRMEAMMIAGGLASKRNIPIIIDVVGVGCSGMRLDYAKKFISECRPNIIKGNMSEIKTMCGIKSNVRGADVEMDDMITKDNIESYAEALKNLALRENSLIIATGETDIIADKSCIYLVKNGCKELSEITGTGCMLNVMTASLISMGNILEGALLAVSLLGICGEMAKRVRGTGSFKTKLLDNIYNVTDRALIKKRRVYEY